MLNEIVLLIFLTFLPTMELRLSIPYGLFVMKLPPLLVIPVVIISNFILGIIVFFLLEKLTDFFLKYIWFSKIYNKLVKRTQRKIKKYVEKYGILGLGIFIGIPIVGSGSWTGALGAHILGIKYKHFIIANLIGVLIAGAIVSLLSLGILSI